MLNHKIFGQGDPIIILHGLFGMLDNWQTIGKKLAEDYMVILVDQRDHGKSKHTGEFNYQVLAEDLRVFMEENWIHEAHIIGHSMGGKTAMQFAVGNPDMIDKLIIVDIGPKAYKAGHDIIFKALREVEIDKVKSRGAVEKSIAKYIDDAGVRLFLMKNLQRIKEGGFRWKMNLELLHKEYPKIIDAIKYDGGIDVETLFIYGSKSNYIVPSEIGGIKEVFTHSTFEEVDSGHWIHAEKPDELLRLVKGFLDE
ncbi:MAG: esterase [Saprospiraceae bacterium]|jgi:esterase|tara:strand:+ start:269 stop:1027 length:759 start_codon:yes stop_codon:yes gene_type:complete